MHDNGNCITHLGSTSQVGSVDIVTVSMHRLVIWRKPG